MTEAIIFSILALLSACVILEIIWIPGFKQLGIMNLELNLDIKQDLSACLQFLGLSIVIGMIAGLSPALYLSAFRPIQRF